MSMREERQEDAAGLEAHAKRMYEETSNPYYVVTAIAAARWGDFLPPKWAMDVLLKAVDATWFKHEASGADMSLDSSLGLRKSRGKKSNERKGRKASIESNVFDLAKIIHSCFDVPIPKACECAYYAIDFDFARSMEETLWQPSNEEQSLPPRLTREEWDAVNAHWKERSTRVIAHPIHTAEVRAKLEACNWWNITHGDRLGYALDQLIDQYYRIGSKRKIPHGKATEQLVLFVKGTGLLLVPERCSHAITFIEHGQSSMRCISAVKALPRRPEFQLFQSKVTKVLG